MTTLEEITARKHKLLADSEAERGEIARVFYRYQARTALARQVMSIFRNPVVLAALGLFTLKMPWRKARRLGGWAWKAWGLMRIIQKFRT